MIIQIIALGSQVAPPLGSLVHRLVRENASNVFSETTGPIKAKVRMAPHWVWGTEVCSLHLGHLTKMVTTPIYIGFCGSVGCRGRQHSFVEIDHEIFDIWCIALAC